MNITVSDFIVLRAANEGLPWSFTGMLVGTGKRKKKLLVRTHDVYLKTGDYSIEGCKNQITIERKSKADAFQTFGSSRERFERELARMR